MQYSNQKRQYLGSVTQIEHQTPQLQTLNKKFETILNRTPWLTSGLNHLLAQMTPCGAVNFFAERVSCKKNSKTRKLQQFTLLLTCSTDYAGPGCINSKAKARQITMDDRRIKTGYSRSNRFSNTGCNASFSSKNVIIPYQYFYNAGKFVIKVSDYSYQIKTVQILFILLSFLTNQILDSS